MGCKIDSDSCQFPDASIANQSLNLMSRGNTQVYLKVSGKTIMSINYNNTTIYSSLVKIH